MSRSARTCSVTSFAIARIPSTSPAGVLSGTNEKVSQIVSGPWSRCTSNGWFSAWYGSPRENTRSRTATIAGPASGHTAGSVRPISSPFPRARRRYASLTYTYRCSVPLSTATAVGARSNIAAKRSGSKTSPARRAAPAPGGVARLAEVPLERGGVGMGLSPAARCV